MAGSRIKVGAGHWPEPLRTVSLRSTECLRVRRANVRRSTPRDVRTPRPGRTRVAWPRARQRGPSRGGADEGRQTSHRAKEGLQGGLRRPASIVSARERLEATRTGRIVEPDWAVQDGAHEHRPTHATASREIMAHPPSNSTLYPRPASGTGLPAWCCRWLRTSRRGGELRPITSSWRISGQA